MQYFEWVVWGVAWGMVIAVWLAAFGEELYFYSGAIMLR